MSAGPMYATLFTLGVPIVKPAMLLGFLRHSTPIAGSEISKRWV